MSFLLFKIISFFANLLPVGQGANVYGNDLMRKNNKYRNNNNYNSQIYSLNYKFDSISSAGKISGTALDLIKRYNELAKEAQGNADYVEAENFRQYAEHYRKIVTEINERKDQRFNNNRAENQQTEAPAAEDNNSETITTTEAVAPVENSDNENKIVPVRKRTFKVIDINSSSADNEGSSEVVATVKRTARTRVSKAKSTSETAVI